MTADVFEPLQIMSQVEGRQKNLVQAIEALPSSGPLSALDQDLLLLKATSAATLSCLGECLTLLQQSMHQVGQNHNRPLSSGKHKLSWVLFMCLGYLYYGTEAGKITHSSEGQVGMSSLWVSTASSITNLFLCIEEDAKFIEIRREEEKRLSLVFSGKSGSENSKTKKGDGEGGRETWRTGR